MKNTTRYWVIGVLAVVLVLVVVWAVGANRPDEAPDGSSSAPSSSETSQERTPLARYLEEQDAIMADMMRDMAAVQQTENASVDFMKGMIPHHESAVAMAKSYLRYDAANEELKALAQDVIDTQTKEVEQMRALIGEIEASGRKDATKSAAYWETYNALFADHDMGSHGDGHNMPVTVDDAFAEGMMVHHQMAVDMAQAILEQTDEEAVKTLAQEIIDAQEREIALMQAILGGNNGSSTGSSSSTPSSSTGSSPSHDSSAH